ncbi:thioether cross-link-forming SCIFF peptide maturase [Klebsiella variicola]|uniref:radical SAM/SPASM domain-containing protein n=1 Tax=Klebsiella pneumoniae complex TaxID=3390273 RepID=UPI001090BC9E|nr:MULTISPECIES: radical SAM protein [Klebsiella]GKN27087.1 thioether cross-link-forming SCIFF peptide maturase [Klebsiella variicola]VGD62443.1 Anaerobic sulfatase-maturating enzyme homolog YdeM [Klebsiella pneumoniae]
MPKFIHKSNKIIYANLTAQSKLENPVANLNHLGLLVLHISEGCNMSCSYCFADKGQYGESKKKLMSFETAKKAINGALDIYREIKAVKFFGGEPFINISLMESVCDYFRTLVDNGRLDSIPDFYAVTNLTIYNNRVKAFLNKNNVHLVGSIDGPQVIHDKHRIFTNGNGTFDLIDKNIKKMRVECSQPKVLEVVYTPEHHRLGFSMIDLHTYLSERYQIKDIAIHPQTGVKLIKNKEYLLKLRELSEEYSYFKFQNAVRLRDLNKIKSVFEHYCMNIQENSLCGLGVNMLTIKANGNIYPCYTLSGFEEYNMASSFDNIGENFTHVQNQFLSNKKTDIQECSRCDILKTCKSCPGSMMQDNGSISKPLNLLCQYNIGTTEGIIASINATRSSAEQWDIVMNAITNPSDEYVTQKFT